MIREYYEAICNGVDVRANLIALRNALKDEKEIRAFAYLLGGDFSVLGSLLTHEDPKVRKNADSDSGRNGDGRCASVPFSCL